MRPAKHVAKDTLSAGQSLKALWTVFPRVPVGQSLKTSGRQQEPRPTRAPTHPGPEPPQHPEIRLSTRLVVLACRQAVDVRLQEARNILCLRRMSYGDEEERASQTSARVANRGRGGLWRPDAWWQLCTHSSRHGSRVAGFVAGEAGECPEILSGLQDMSPKQIASWLQESGKQLGRLDELVQAAKGFLGAKSMGADGFEVKPEDKKAGDVEV